MKRVLKKLLIFSLAGVMCFSIFACKDGGNSSKNEYKIFVAPSTVKILQDKDYDFTSKEIIINAAKNEYESSQIVIDETSDIKSYTVETGDLVGDAGAITKENIKVFNQKYIEVKKTTSIMDTGFYPDALLPMDNAIEFHENKVKKGDKQGIWIEFFIPKNTVAGVYKGQIIVDVGGEKNIVPVKLNVYDVTVSEKVRAKSSFLTSQYYLMTGELDSSMEMQEKYYDSLLDFRLSSMFLPSDLGRDLDTFIASAKKYTQDDRCSAFTIPIKTALNPVYNDADVDYVQAEEYISRMVEESVKSGINLFSKANIHMGAIIDEPEIAMANGDKLIIARTNRICKSLKEMITKIYNKYNADTAITGANKAEVLQGLKNIQHLVTNQYSTRLPEVDVWCPKVDKFDLAEEREKYSEKDWWYFCIGVNTPYPTYFLDDNLLSARLMSWMQKDYNVGGNLYWETAFYKKIDVNGVPIDKPFDWYDNAERFPGTNGDGFLFYPGKPYGISGPVASIRLQSLRDGLEEYELLYDLEDSYEAEQLDSGEITRLLYDKLYSGVKCNSDLEVFASVRNTLLELGELADKDIFVSSAQPDNDKITLEIVAPNGVTVKDGQTALTPSASNEYLLAKTLDKADNNISLRFEKDSSLVGQLNIDCGGKVTVVADFEKPSDADIFEVSGSKEIVSENGNSVLQVTLDKFDNKTQSVKITGDSVASIGANTDSIALNIYNPSDKPVRFEVLVQGKSAVLVSIHLTTLKSGHNRIEIPRLMLKNWNDIGKVKNITCLFGNKGDERRILTLDNIIVKNV